MDVRSIGVVGLDYSGSTILNGALGVLPGVFAAAETHWIVDRDLGCRECGKAECPILTNEVLADLRRDQSDWWGRLRACAGADVVVSTDKNPQHYDRFGVPDALLYLHREPQVHLASRLRRTRDDHPSEEAAREAAAGWYNQHALKRLKWLRKVGRPVLALSLEDWVGDPEGTIRALCRAWGLEYSPLATEFWTADLHYVGGNFSLRAQRRKGMFEGGLRLPTDVAVDTEDRIHPKVHELVAQLDHVVPVRA